MCNKWRQWLSQLASSTPVLTIQFKSSWFHRLAHPQWLWKLLRLCWLWSLRSAAVSAVATAVPEDQTFKLMLLLLLQLQICWRGISTIKSYDLKSVHYTSVSLEDAKRIHIAASVCVMRRSGQLMPLKLLQVDPFACIRRVIWSKFR